jgi:hypothetical protein
VLEYWHIGDIPIRFGRTTSRMDKGDKRLAAAIIVSPVRCALT